MNLKPVENTVEVKPEDKVIKVKTEEDPFANFGQTIKVSQIMETLKDLSITQLNEIQQQIETIKQNKQEKLDAINNQMLELQKQAESLK